MVTEAPRRSRLFDALRVLAFLLVAVGLYQVVQVYDLRALGDPEVLHARVDGMGAWAVVFYLALWVVFQCALGQTVIPTLAGSVMFGWAAGAGLAVFGAFFATSVHYWLVRLLLRGPAEALVLRRFPRLKEGIEERGLALLVLLRFLWFPSMLVTMGSAVTRTSFRTHLMAIPAILPQAFLWCLGTDSLYTYGWDGIPLWRWALFVGVVAASILAYIYATRRWPQLKAFTRKA